jgi:hypothetical protein
LLITLTLPNEAVFFYFSKLSIQQTLSPLYNWFYIDFLGAKVEIVKKEPGLLFTSAPSPSAGKIILEQQAQAP